MKNIVFDPKAFKQFNEWAIEDKKLYKKIVDLIDDILRHPFSGIGKPEPLKHQLKGYLSRRINDEHRLVYKITETEIMITALLTTVRDSRIPSLPCLPSLFCPRWIPKTLYQL
jgi:toxin YoeB